MFNTDWDLVLLLYPRYVCYDLHFAWKTEEMDTLLTRRLPEAKYRSLNDYCFVIGRSTVTVMAMAIMTLR